MPELSVAQNAAVRQFPQHTERFLSIAPREALFSAQIDLSQLFYDGKSGGFYALKYTSPSGLAGLCETDMTVAIGTQPGADDIGRVRLRGAIDTVNNVVRISETPYGDLPLSSPCYLTVYNAFEPASRIIRLVGIKTNNSKFENDFIEYHDYDQVYVNQNQRIRPIVNFYSSMEGGVPIFPRLAGWVDEGVSYREITLSAQIINLGIPAETFTYSWNIRDCTLVAGSLTGSSVTIRVPVGFRYVKLVVTNGGGNSQTKHLPLWTHDASYPPVGDNRLGFNITSDNTEDGREMSVDIFGTDINENIVPKGTLMCYWEMPTNAVAAFRTQFWGWVSEISYPLEEYGTMQIKIEGIAGWMKKLVGFGTQLNERNPPTKWFEMPGISLSRYLHYLLREYSTVLNMCNFYAPTTDARWTKAEQTTRASLWEQCRNLSLAYGMRAFLADSNNALWVKPKASYLKNGTFGFPNERTSLVTVTTLTPDDLDSESAVALNQEIYKPVGRADGTGNIWTSASKDPVVVSSRAPSKSSGQGQGTEELPYQRLLGSKEAEAQNELNWYVGQHYALKNSRLQKVDITLVGNMDIFEPAWGEQVRFVWNNSAYPTLTGESIDTLFAITRVDINHSQERGTRRKTVRMTLEEVTFGVPGVTVPIPKGQWIDNPMWDFFWNVNPALPDYNDPPPLTNWEGVLVSFALAGDKNSGKLGMTYEFDRNSPRWEDVTPSFPSGAELFGFDAKFVGEALQVKAVYISYTANMAYIYNTSNIFEDVVTWRKEAEFSLGTSEFDGIAAIRADQDNNLWAFVYVCTDGVRCRTSAGTGSWGSPIVVGSTAVISPSLTLKHIGLDVFDNRILTSGKDTLGNWLIYTGTGLIPTFTATADGRTSGIPWNTLRWGPGKEFYAAAVRGVPHITTFPNSDLTETLTRSYLQFGRMANRDFDFYYGLTGYYNYTDTLANLSGSVFVTEGRYTNPPLIQRINVGALTDTPFPYGLGSTVLVHGSGGPFDPAYIDLTFPFRIRIEFTVETDKGTFYRTVRVAYKQARFDYFSSPPYASQITLTDAEISGDDDITIPDGDDFVAFRIRSFYIRYVYETDMPEAIVGGTNRIEFASGIAKFYYELLTDKVVHQILDPTALPASLINFFMSSEFTSSPTSPLNLYLANYGGVVPFSRNGISVRFDEGGRFTMCGSSASGRFVEARLAYGSQQKELEGLADVTGVKVNREAAVVFGSNMLQMRWKYRTYDNKMGNWEDVISSNPDFVDVVAVL